jgi:3-hydroxybutyryl-CoA dehydratase
MPKAATMRFADIALGQTAQFEVVITEEMVSQFAALSGDNNPLHMDEAYAKETQFKGRIAHGFLGASFFSQLIGMHLPGTYALYLSEQISFKLPIYIGMHLTVKGEVIQKVDSVQTIKIKTEILDKKTSDCLIGGEAMVKLLA